MSSLRTLVCGLVFALTAQQAQAEDPFLNTVAGCVGRLSAQMEHHWLFHDKPTAQIETQRAHMLDILEALTTHQNARSVLSTRIAAKLAHASLLTRAAFSHDPKSMAWARAQSDRQLALCSTITLAAHRAPQEKQMTVSDASTEQKTVNQRAVQVKQ